MEIRLPLIYRISCSLYWNRSSPLNGSRLLTTRQAGFGSRRNKERPVKLLPQSDTWTMPRVYPGQRLKLIPSTELTTLVQSRARGR